MASKDEQNVNRYEEMGSRVTSTIDLIGKIERKQTSIRIYEKINYYWNILTFRGHKNKIKKQKVNVRF